MFGTCEYLDLVGRPFDPETWNCWSLCCCIWERLGQPLPAYPYVERGALCGAEFEARRMQFTRLLYAAPWCIVVMRYPYIAVHAGIVLPDCTSFIHVGERYGTVITPLRRYQKLIEGYYTYETSRTQ